MEYFPRTNWKKQKESNEKRKSEQPQKPTKVQLDEEIEVKVNAKIDGTVPNEVRTIMAKSLRRTSFISSKIQKKYSEANLVLIVMKHKGWYG